MTRHRQHPRALQGSNGMVATAHPLATESGLGVLRAGGNAMDAAIAASAVLGVVQPMMSGIGGDTFVVVYDAGTRQVRALNGSGPAPRELTPEYLERRGHGALPMHGMLSIAVPGAVDAMETALREFGSGRFGLAELLAPAVRYAEDGVPVAPMVARFFRNHERLLASFPGSRAAYFVNGAVVEEGAVLRQPDLARTLRILAHQGRDAFYQGEIAERIVSYVRAHGGLLAPDDLAGYRCELVEPISIRYRGSRIYTNPPVSQGIVLLEALKIVEGLVPQGLAHEDAASVHALVEAVKIAFADRNATLGDPRFVSNPVSELLSHAHVARRRRQIRPARTLREVAPTGLCYSSGDTTSLATADREGNLVAFITSLSTPFGSGEVVEGTGILLNNRAGRGFVLDHGHPNVLAGGKRTMNTLHAYLVRDEAGGFIAGGCAGGDGQPQWNLQILTRVIDGGQDLADAIAAPRWESFPGTDPQTVMLPYRLRFDPRFPRQVVEALGALGHRIADESLGMLGAAQAVQRLPAGLYVGAADPRADGVALGY